MGNFGTKIRFKELPIGEEDIGAVTNVLKSKSLGMGTTVNVLEEEFADYVGSEYAVAVNSCTNSLFLSMLYFIKGVHSAHINVPSMMVPLVPNEIIHAQCIPYFNNDTDWVGHHYKLDKTNIIDSAHEVIRGLHDFNEYTVCYSFYPTKPVCGADGGMICTNDEDAAKWYRKARFFGRDDGSSLTKNSWEYKIEFPGWKMNMSDVQAAIALTNLRRHPWVDSKMTRIREKYNDLLGYENTSNYLYRIEVENRDAFISYMSDNNVECGVHFYPLHMMEAYKDFGRDDMTEVESVYYKTVSLPFHTFLTDDQIEYICEKVYRWEYTYA